MQDLPHSCCQQHDHVKDDKRNHTEVCARDGAVEECLPSREMIHLDFRHFNQLSNAFELPFIFGCICIWNGDIVLFKGIEFELNLNRLTCTVLHKADEVPSFIGNAELDGSFFVRKVLSMDALLARTDHSHNNAAIRGFIGSVACRGRVQVVGRLVREALLVAKFCVKTQRVA